MKKGIIQYAKLTCLILLSNLAACQSMGLVNTNEEDSYDYATFKAQEINLYHNVHYNNPGFYPKESSPFSGYSMRGYRY